MCGRRYEHAMSQWCLSEFISMCHSHICLIFVLFKGNFLEYRFCRRKNWSAKGRPWVAAVDMGILTIYTPSYLTGKIMVIVVKCVLSSHSLMHISCVSKFFTIQAVTQQWWIWTDCGWYFWKLFASPLSWSTDAKDCKLLCPHIFCVILVFGVCMLNYYTLQLEG